MPRATRGRRACRPSRPAGPSRCYRQLEVVDRLDLRVPDLLERLVRELGLERCHEPRGRLAGRVRDDVELDDLAGGRHPPEATAATRASVSVTRSPGASSSSSPRRPALTKIVSWPSADSSTTVGSRFRCPSGLIPPRTYPVARSARGPIGKSGPLAERAQVELCGDRDDRDGELAVLHDDERLEDARRDPRPSSPPPPARTRTLPGRARTRAA